MNDGADPGGTSRIGAGAGADPLAGTRRDPGGDAGPRLPGAWRAAAALFVLLGLLFGALLLARQWAELGRLEEEARTLTWRLHPGWLAAALLLATANLFGMGAVWARLHRATGATLGAGEAIRIWILTGVGRYIPGKVWQLGGLAAWVRRLGGSGAGAVFSSLAFQVLVLATGTAVAVGLLGPWLRRLPGGALIGAAALVAALLPLLHPGSLATATRRAGRLVGEDVDPRRLRARDLGVAAVGLGVAWLVYGVGLWCLLRGLLGEAPVPPLGLAGVFAAAYVAGYAVVFAPGGLVVREGALAALLAAVGGLPLGAAAALAVAARLWTTASELVALLAAAPRWRGRDRGGRRGLEQRNGSGGGADVAGSGRGGA